MKVIKIAVDGVQLRIRQTSDRCALCDAGEYGVFFISNRLTTKDVVARIRERRYMRHMCIECGCIMQTPSMLGTCGNCE